MLGSTTSCKQSGYITTPFQRLNPVNLYCLKTNFGITSVAMLNAKDPCTEMAKPSIQTWSAAKSSKIRAESTACSLCNCCNKSWAGGDDVGRKAYADETRLRRSYMKVYAPPLVGCIPFC